jgi:hypothetical protein
MAPFYPTGLAFGATPSSSIPRANVAPSNDGRNDRDVITGNIQMFLWCILFMVKGSLIVLKPLCDIRYLLVLPSMLLLHDRKS